MSDEFEKVRPSMRSKTMEKEESPRERAARKAAEFRAHRSNRSVDDVDEYFIEPGIIPDGWTYEWKTQEIYGASQDSHITALLNSGWEFVPASRHPEMMPRGHKGETITRKGMVLMERPAEITAEVRQEEMRRARLQVRAKEEQLSASEPGQFERANKGNDMVKIKKGYEAMPIPEE